MNSVPVIHLDFSSTQCLARGDGQTLCGISIPTISENRALNTVRIDDNNVSRSLEALGVGVRAGILYCEDDDKFCEVCVNVKYLLAIN